MIRSSLRAAATTIAALLLVAGGARPRAAAAQGVTPAAAPTPAPMAGGRTRVWVARDTTYDREWRLQHERLMVRMDSLRRRLEEGGLEPAERVRLSRELNTCALAIGTLVGRAAERAAMAATAGSFVTRRRQVWIDSAYSARMAGRMAGELATAMREGFGATAVPVPMAQGARGWIGLNVEAPHLERIDNGRDLYVRYLDYPSVVSVEPNSPAERAGVSRGDVVLAFEGRDVRGNEINVSRLLTPSRRIEVTVKRDGDTRVVPMIVGRAPGQVQVRRLNSMRLPAEAVTLPAIAPMADDEGDVRPLRPVRPRVESATPAPPPPPAQTWVFSFDPSGSADAAGVAGARVVEVNRDLGRAFGVTSGLLVIEAASGTPARQSGLRGGDVILKVAGDRVTSIGQLRGALRDASDRRLELEVMRERRPVKVMLEW